MRILILDDNEIIVDDPETYVVDPDPFKTDEILQVRGPVPFFRLLYDEPWDEVWLDGDLGDPSFSGQRATYLISEEFHMRRKVPTVGLWRIITMNTVAGPRMQSDLEGCGFKVVQTPIFLFAAGGIRRGELIPLTDCDHVYYPNGEPD